ncbi:MAG TPA: geranylgeranylglycerol-phosphate geranylgeranyltransferase [Anaerolineales bacterium]|nr:geranylgeranylglycerol-phosphate geranylgeranyltransferase [Anaerolineales bacterium]
MIKPFLLLTRPFMSAMPALATVIAVQIGSPGQALSWPALTLGAASACLSAGSMVINDWFDAEIDKINKPTRPIPSGQVSKTHALVFALALFAAGLASSLVVRYDLAVSAGIVILLSAAYSWFLKRFLLVGNVLVAAVSSYPLFAGGLLTHGLSKLVIPIAVTFIFIFGREILKDVEDTQGDARFGVMSIANRWGVGPAVYVGLALMSLALLVAIGQYLLKINDEWFLICLGLALVLDGWLAYRLLRDRSERNVAKSLDLSAIILLIGSFAFVTGLR